LNAATAIEPTALPATPADRWTGAVGRATRALERWRKPLGWVLLAAMTGWLLVRLHALGWRELWAARPGAPSFYVLVAVGYLALPAADALIYRRLWRTGWRDTLAVCLRKRVYNTALVGYSGEVGLLVWARSRIGTESVVLAHTIKDVNVLSAVVSSYAAAGLIGWLATRVAFDRLPNDGLVWWGAVTLAIAALTPLVLLARRGIIAMPMRQALEVFAIHTLRFGAGLALLLVQWRVALPGAGWTALTTLLAIQVLVGRLPLVPNRDVLFAGVALAVSGNLAMDETALAGVLVMTSALQQVLHLVAFVLAGVLAEPQR
jgi:hypothetical protein